MINLDQIVIDAHKVYFIGSKAGAWCSVDALRVKPAWAIYDQFDVAHVDHPLPVLLGYAVSLSNQLRERQ